LEFDSPKCFGEDVSELVRSGDACGANSSIIQAAPDEVIAELDVLAALMEDGVLSQCQGRLAVHLKLYQLLDSLA
jgi:hypothetical protein